MTKVCKICEQEKSLEEFDVGSRYSLGRRPYCKICRNSLSKDYRNRNKEKVNSYRRSYHAANKDKIAEQRKTWISARPEPETSGSKKCGMCSQTKSLEEFYKDIRGLHGRTARCCLCVNKINRQWNEKNKDRKQELSRVHYRDNREKRTSQIKEWSIKNRESINKRMKHLRAIMPSDRKEKVLVKKKEYRIKSADKIKRYRKKYNKEKPWVSRQGAAKRRSAKIQRTPKWANLSAIKEFYKNCPKGFVVDHIIPLRGKTVSGLHVEYNLQYLTSEENSRKSNKVL